jgi:hypothetical protein
VTVLVLLHCLLAAYWFAMALTQDHDTVIFATAGVCSLLAAIGFNREVR